MSEAQIDYSRPVGWWCPVCTRVSMGDYLLQAIRLNRRCLDTDEARQRRLHMVPVYLPIPEGQRPPAASEVEEAEIATSTKGWGITWYGIGSKGRMVYRAECSWNYTLDTEHIERVTGATE